MLGRWCIDILGRWGGLARIGILSGREVKVSLTLLSMTACQKHGDILRR